MKIHKDFQLSQILWYKIGGKTKYFLQAENQEDIEEALDFINTKNINKVFICGLGSNLIFSDDYFEGAVIQITQNKRTPKNIVIKDNFIQTFSGSVFDDVIKFSFDQNLIGLEWAGGLPGTIGAGMRGNVGAFGGEIKDNFDQASVIEINNKGFYVERSKNGKDFSSIGFVKGAGNSNKIVNYTYTDVSLKDINVSKTYYRLNQVDMDGKSTYSKVISLSLENPANAGNWKLYPNPVKDVATVELNLEASSKVKAQLVSRDGKTVLNVDKGVLNEGTQQFYINTQSLAKGSYILRVTIGEKTNSRLLIKE